MKERIEINGIWYVAESDVSDTFEEFKYSVDDIIPYHGFLWEDGEICMELDVILEKDYSVYEGTHPSLEITFKIGEKSDWKVEYWDNGSFLKTILENKEEDHILTQFSKVQVKVLKEMLSRAKDLGWFTYC